MRVQRVFIHSERLLYSTTATRRDIVYSYSYKYKLWKRGIDVGQSVCCQCGDSRADW